MDSNALLQAIGTAVPEARVESAPSVDLHPTLIVARDDVPAIAQALWSRPELAFSLLIELTAVDFWPREPRFEVIYLLVSLEHRQRLRLKVRLAGNDPHLATVSSIWPAANWLEREVWDLFGIAFDGHPDPRRLLMPEDWEGHPLRKDYPVQIRKTPQIAAPLQMTEEEFRRNVQKDRLKRSSPDA